MCIVHCLNKCASLQNHPITPLSPLLHGFEAINNNLSFKVSFLTLYSTTSLHSVVVSTLDSQSRGLGSNLSQGKKIFFSQNAKQEVEWSTGSVDLKQFAKNRGKIIIRWIKWPSFLQALFHLWLKTFLISSQISMLLENAKFRQPPQNLFKYLHYKVQIPE